ncbi:hypothetical protein [Sphingomonas sp. 3P27F8]|uniref:hypothetical protein n=1 Tax=Sphingomonas sp. 3P27F8 TaxID=2502213 RepID=UPI0010F70790|nr:hypothetical protein [Sphingomonas sp. 3P27F8]
MKTGILICVETILPRCSAAAKQALSPGSKEDASQEGSGTFAGLIAVSSAVHWSAYLSNQLVDARTNVEHRR